MGRDPAATGRERSAVPGGWGHRSGEGAGGGGKLRLPAGTGSSCESRLGWAGGGNGVQGRPLWVAGWTGGGGGRLARSWPRVAGREGSGVRSPHSPFPPPPPLLRPHRIRSPFPGPATADWGPWARPAVGEGAAWSRPLRGEGRQFLSAELKGFKGRLLKGPQKGPGAEEASLPIRLLSLSRGVAGPRRGMQRKQTLVAAAKWPEPWLVGLGPRWPASRGSGRVW